MKILEFKALFNYLKKKIWILIVLAILFCGFQYVRMDKKEVIKYSSEASVLLLSDITEDEYEFYKENSNELCNRIVKSSSVINKVIKNLELKYNVQQISNNVSIENINNGEIIKIKYINFNEDETVEIVNSIAKSFAKKMNSLYKFKNVEVIDEAESFNTLISNTKKDIIIELVKMFIAGSVVGLGIIFIMYYFDSTIKSIDEFEELNLNVLGEFSKKDKNIQILGINLSNIIKNKRLKKIMITSTLKTNNNSIVSKLGFALSNLGHKVLIIDFNSIDINQSYIKDLKINTDSKGEIIKANINNLFIASCKDFNLTEINNKINKFSEGFDVVLINGENINISEKSLMACNISDGIVFIEKMNKTKNEQIKKSISYIKETEKEFLGVVVNNI